MEPVTHILTGACLARTGLNRRAAYATFTMAIAAEFPDIDTLWSLRGPVASFQHHRGITHTFLALPFEAALLVGVAFLVHQWRSKRAKALGKGTATPMSDAPVNWWFLFLFALLALLSHLLLDFTNNYGIRPFFPFDTHWYAASITFIFDPLMFLFLVAALVLPSIFRLVGSEVGAQRQHFAPRGWALAALLAVVALWTLREVQHNHAIDLAMTQSLDDANGSEESTHRYLQPLRVLANPDPLTPFRWWTVTDFGAVYQLGEANTRAGSFYAGLRSFPKPAVTPALLAAEQSRLGRVYLDWSPVPVLSTVQEGTAQAEGMGLVSGHTLVTFRDPRFMGDIPMMRSRTPLTGTVELDARNRVVRETMDGKEQR